MGGRVRDGGRQAGRSGFAGHGHSQNFIPPHYLRFCFVHVNVSIEG